MSKIAERLRSDNNFLKITMRCVLIYVAVCLFVLCYTDPADATVYEFGADGQVKKYEAFDYLTKSRHKNDHISAARPETKAEYDVYVSTAAQKYRVPENLIHAVILAESAYRNSAISYKGAQGLMQLMPETARTYGVRNAFDPEQNIDGGTRYLRDLLDRYDENLEIVLAAYNAGEGAVDKYDGIPPYRETRQYVQKILENLDKK